MGEVSIRIFQNLKLSKIVMEVSDLKFNNMQQWELSIGFTRKLKLSTRPNILSSSSISRICTIARQGESVTYDRSNQWILNSITCGLKWFNHLQDFLSRLTVRLFEHTVIVSF